MKGAYRSMSLKQKRGKDNLKASKASIRSCLSEEVITKVIIRIFARRARQYLMAYHAINTHQVDKQTQHNCTTHGPVALTKLIKGQFKTHRCAFNFDFKFIMGAWWSQLSSLCVLVLFRSFCNNRHRITHIKTYIIVGRGRSPQSSTFRQLSLFHTIATKGYPKD